MALTDELWMQRILDEERARLAGLARAWAYYYGRHEDTLTVKRGQPDHNVTVNFVRLAVDVAVAALFGQEVTFDLDPDAATLTPAEAWLNAVWASNGKMLLLQKAATNGAVCGHVFVKIVPAGRVTADGTVYPKLVNLSPEYVTVLTDPDDIEQVLRYRIEYAAVGTDGKQVTLRQDIERQANGTWQITDARARGAEKFETQRILTWPYVWPPIVDCQNIPAPNEYYGQPDVDEDLIALNRAINFLTSNTGRILYFHGHPKTWGRGFRADEIKVAVDETLVLESASAELHNLEMQSDLASSLAFYARLKEAWHEIARTPEVATGKVENVGALSGVALRILYAPLLQKTESKQLAYGPLLVELNRRLLELGGFGPANLCTIGWGALLPGDPLSERQVALLDKQLGVSDDTLLRKLGYDPDVERVKRERNVADLGEQLLTAFDRGTAVPGQVRAATADA